MLIASFQSSRRLLLSQDQRQQELLQLPDANFTVARTDAANAFVGNQTIAVGQTTSAQTDLLINPTTKASGNLIDAQVNGVSKFSVTSAGTLTAALGGTFGSSGVTVNGGDLDANNIKVHNTGVLQFSDGTAYRTVLTQVSEGVITLSTSSINRLQFGGTTSSFPAIKRNSAAINFRLADDSADAAITSAGITASGAITTSSTTDSTTTTSGALQVAGGAAIRKRVFIDGITTSAGLQTAVLCQSSGGEMIADSVACLASSRQIQESNQTSQLWLE
jgi:hypothetical protein